MGIFLKDCKPFTNTGLNKIVLDIVGFFFFKSLTSESKEMENKIQKTVFYRAQFVLKIINAYLRANPRTLAASENLFSPLQSSAVSLYCSLLTTGCWLSLAQAVYVFWVTYGQVIKINRLESQRKTIPAEMVLFKSLNTSF